MTSPGSPADAAVRERALDLGGSYIVRAPAGSGKTELLTQRYLALLAVAGQPEEVLAITFTRKAAAEMRNRVLCGLTDARGGDPPQAAHQQRSWTLAKSVLGRDTLEGWNLQAHPARLRILTIDGLNMLLTRQMPYLSRSGAPLSICDEPQALYREAARQTLAALGSSDRGADAVERLLVHLDNRADQVERLLMQLLGRRDHWLRRIVGRGAQPNARRILESGIRHLVEDHLVVLAAAVPSGIGAELAALARYAARHLDANVHSPIHACAGLDTLPGAHAADLPGWRGIAAVLLTGDGHWRRRVNVRQGFPPRNPAMNERVLALLRTLDDAHSFRDALHATRQLPAPAYSDEQWETLAALLEVLPLCAAHLEVAFRQRGNVDYVAVAERALLALGAPDTPTDLALTMDHRIRHILVDEFQDTSVGQYQLLLRLTAGWTPGDGRTLFCVGDPMQSIYRFREAEVGFYLRACREGIGDVPLRPLELTVNFRSQQNIADWVNRAFPEILPADDNLARGAVAYSSCAAHREPLPGRAVRIHAQLEQDSLAEAELVADLVCEARSRDPSGSVAILVSSRSHLEDIVPRLQARDLRFRAIEIKYLARRVVVQDLVALTRALVHLADRTAWLAVLRAPWCGLSLADLHGLVQGQAAATLWESINDAETLSTLSDDGRTRIVRLRKVMAAAMSCRGRTDLRGLVEGTWLQLGGPATVAKPADLEDADAYLTRLESLDEGCDLADPGTLEANLEELFAAPDLGACASLQIMTVHRAKGLQFDTVILPGLGRWMGGEEKHLLRWLEVTRPGRASDLVLAPVEPHGAARDSLHAYLNGLERERDRLERARLLYVAVTRARNYLHLLGHINLAENDAGEVLKRPDSRSLLALLWPVVAPHFGRALQARRQGERRARSKKEKAAGIRRLVAGWTLPPPPDRIRISRDDAAAARQDETGIEFDWARETIRVAGIAVHRMLHRISIEGLGAWGQERISGCGELFEKLLADLGLPLSAHEEAVALVRKALLRTVSDPRGRWILSRHCEARSEYALSGEHGGRILNVVIDRTLVDEHGVRWIVDYKTSRHEGSDVESFLDNEQERYRAQLESYAALIRRADSRPIRLGLYFPLLSGWREWPAMARNSSQAAGE